MDVLRGAFSPKRSLIFLMIGIKTTFLWTLNGHMWECAAALRCLAAEAWVLFGSCFWHKPFYALDQLGGGLPDTIKGRFQLTCPWSSSQRSHPEINKPFLPEGQTRSGQSASPYLVVRAKDQEIYGETMNKPLSL